MRSWPCHASTCEAGFGRAPVIGGSVAEWPHFYLPVPPTLRETQFMRTRGEMGLRPQSAWIGDKELRPRAKAAAPTLRSVARLVPISASAKTPPPPPPPCSLMSQHQGFLRLMSAVLQPDSRSSSHYRSSSHAISAAPDVTNPRGSGNSLLSPRSHAASRSPAVEPAPAGVRVTMKLAPRVVAV